MSSFTPSSTSVKRLSLRANFSWTFAGNLFYAACQWGMLVVLAKLGSPEKVGQFSLALAVTGPVIMFTNLKLRSVQATDAKNEYLFSDYLSLRLLSTLLALLVISIIVWSTDYQRETAAIILVMGLAKGFEAISDVFYGLLQKHERMDRIAKSFIIKGPFSLAALGLAVFLTESVLWGVIALAVVWAVLLLMYDIRSGVLIMRASGVSAQSLKPCWRWSNLRSLAWLALPLGIGMLLISLKANIPRYVIEQHWGEAMLGIYAAMAYLKVAGNTIVLALGQSASPRLAQYYAEGNIGAYRYLLLRLVGIGVVLGIGAVAFAEIAGKQFLTLVYTSEYAVYSHTFVLIMVAAGLSYIASFLEQGMTAARYFRVQIPLYIVAVGITTVASLLLIPLYGLPGAALALILSLIVQILCGFFVILYILRARVSQKENVLS